MAEPVRPLASQGAPVHIETNGYLLRSLTAQDVTPRFVEWLNNSDMLSGLNLASLNLNLEQLKAFVSRFDNHNSFIIGIFDPSNGLLIGFYTLDINHVHRTGNITTGLGEKDYQGKGVLWATIDALLDHFYLYRGVEKVTARILARNLRMLFNFRGDPRFKFEAKLSRECLGPGGKRLDVLVFASHKAP